MATFDFGPFRLETHLGRLTCGGRRISLPLKTFEILRLLVEARGDLVHRDTFQKTLWPDTVVEERNLTVQISTLRRAMKQAGGDGAIETVPGRGYRLAVPVTLVGEAREGGHASANGRSDGDSVDRPAMTFRWALALGVTIAAVAAAVAALHLGRAGGTAGADHLEREARALLNRVERESTFEALELFQRAVALAPVSATAHAGVGDAYLQLSSTRIGRPLSLADSARLAREAAGHALALDAQNADALALVGRLRFYIDWDWPQAEAALQQAAQQSPDSANVRLSYGRYLVAMGRFDEGLAELEEARRLNPLARRFTEVLGYEQFVSGRSTDVALALLDAAARLDPESPLPHSRRLWILDYLERHDEATARAATGLPRVARRRGPNARDTCQPSRDMKPSPSVGSRQSGRWWEVAHGEMVRGRQEAVLDAIERCVDERCTDVPWLRVEPSFLPLHGVERFERLIARLGLEDVRPARFAVHLTR